MSFNASLGANSIAFTNFSIEEDNDSSIQFKNSGSVVAEIDGTGILYDNTGTDLEATTMTGAINEVDTLLKNTLQWVGPANLKFIYRFSNSTGDADPGDGKLRLNNGTYASVTQMYIDNLEYAKKVDVRALLLKATGPIQIYIQKTSDTGKWVLFDAEGIDTTESGYLKFNNLSMTNESGSALSDGKDVIVVLAKKQGQEIKNVNVPALPADDTGSYTLNYNSATQTFSWTSV